MRKKISFIAALLCLCTLCGCTKIPDLGSSSELVISGTETSDDTSGQKADTEKTASFIVVAGDYVKKLEAESGAFSGKPMNGDGEASSADDADFIRLKDKEYLTQVANLTTSQFYRVIIAARSEKGAYVKLTIGDTVEGAYYVPPSEEGSEDFKLYAVDNLYMPVGLNTLNFTVENGGADIDYIITENSAACASELYNTGNSCVSPSTSDKTSAVMKTLAYNYGKQTFLAQNVSCGTNAEIDAIFKETKRYPAIRTSELAPLLKSDDEKSAEMIKNDLALARQWSDDGGFCAYTFHWYSPNILRSTELGAFKASEVFTRMEAEELAKLDGEAMKYQVENDILTEDCEALINDLDKLAAKLKELADADVPILFEPMPNAETGAFWWGADADSYKNLWKLMFSRLCEYHKLNNLIWVWNNSDYSYYPGDRYVDIIGQSFYESSSASFAGRFSAIGGDVSAGRKMIALTACATLPNISFMYRDNAMWLWTAPDSGEYMINNSGSLNDKHTKRAALNFAYNNEKCVTRDELEGLIMVAADD